MTYRSRPLFVQFVALCAVTFIAQGLARDAHADNPKPTTTMDWPVVHPQVAVDWPVVYPDDSISILLAGDTGFGGHGQPVRAGSGMRKGRAIPYATMTDGIKGLLTTDAAFANLETVITSHNRLRPAAKRFVFRSHPSSLTHLSDLGFNLFSTSNNHVGDFGRAGIKETLQHLQDLKRDGRRFAAAGLGRDRDHAMTPQKLTVKGADLYLSAIGIGRGNTNARSKPARPGHLAYRSTQDFSDVLAALRAIEGGYRMLSVHYGEEGQVYPSRRDVQRLRDLAVRGADIDLVIGHHAHVARGIQRIDDKLIFYGLGNFLHPGMQDMARFDRCRDFGLVARVHLGRVDRDRYRAMALEVIPMTGMHVKPRPMRPDAAKMRVRVLNGLAKQLDSKQGGTARGVRFVAQPDGRGVACFAGSEYMRGEIRALCGQVDNGTASTAYGDTTSVSCSGRSFRGASYSKPRKRKRRKKTGYFNPFGF
ncbi:MAG: CapA family protein [Alphaproteobacteria bacterium]|nr:CapA family protein [Alphaproteobacteria bacterium]